MLEWPSLCATLATDTPSKRSSDAWVWRRPWMVMAGMPALAQRLLSASLTVELKILLSSPTKIGLSCGRSFMSEKNWMTVCQSSLTFLTEDLFFVGWKPF